MPRFAFLRRAAAFVGFALLLTLGFSEPASAEVSVCNLFTDHMVLQQKQKNRVWGWAKPGEAVTVAIGEQSHKTEAGEDGYWEVMLDALPAGGPHTLSITGENEITCEDVLVGEVWICSGQSNMAWPVAAADDPDLESLTAKFPKIRLISVPQVGTQEPQTNFQGEWQVCTPENVKQFSAVGYFFGRQLHQTIDVPIGLIDNAWGGSAVEAWINRDKLTADPQFEPLLERWEKIEANYDHEAAMKAHEERTKVWKAKAEAARAVGKPVPNRPRPPRNQLAGNQRPANIYNGVLKPTIGYGIRGTIWYQGESNASRAYQYRELFPLMIRTWREEWGQGDFPFYWVSLADFRAEVDAPGGSDWAELREAQTMTLKLPNTGQAVITDLGEADDIHPKNKQDVAKRLARLALADVYGYDIVARSPVYESMQREGAKIRITFSEVGGGLDTFDTRRVQGVTIAGEDQVFVPANAQIVGKNELLVWSDTVKEPVAVRYAWADNPIANLQNKEGLPVTPFRTDDWQGVTADNK